MTRTVVVGAGRIARRHYLPALSRDPRTVLVGVWDIDAEAARSAAHELPEGADLALPEAGQDVDDFLRIVGPDLVVNLTSHAAHLAVTRSALSAGCSVYSEKPLARTRRDALELLHQAEAADLGLSAAPYVDGAPLIEACRRVLDSGELGLFHSAYLRYSCATAVQGEPVTTAALREGGGVLVDLAIYPLAILDAVVGPADLAMCARTITDRGDDDLVEAWSLGLQLAGGAHAVVQSSSHAHDGAFALQLRLMGTDGDAVLDGGNLFSTSLSVSSSAQKAWHVADVGPSSYHWVEGPLRFAADLQSGRRPRDIARALRVTEIIEQAHSTSPALQVES